MVNDNWFLEIESKIFTQIEYMLTQREDAPYPEMKCTTVSQNTVTHFPTLYLHELQPVEVGMDLTNESVNAVMSTVEIQVWSNISEYDCKEIFSAVIIEMKRMGFNVTMFPSVQTDSKIAWGAARFRRVVGAGDTLVQ